MWIYVPSGQDMTAHRTFFFKGDVSSSERTPSAFFAPGTSKLLLQLSTEDNLEESIESNTEVVEDSWTHYVFKLEEFQYSVYVDGVLDSTLVLSSSAIHNEEDLLVGWAPGLTGHFMASYAGMLYWGARGFERDHPKALELWNKAAAHDHVGALCGAASMYVRGEGTEVDVTKAVEYYERAAAMDSATALNGLGYAYFFGQGGLPVDKSKAFTYFMRAADLENDADSLTNAAHCYNHDEAFWWYSKSAVAGSIKGTYYVAFMHEHHNRDLDRAISQYSKALRLVESGDNGLEMILLVKFSIWRCEMKKGALWKAVWGYLSGGNGADLAPLPPLPIKRQVEDDDEGGIAEEIEGEGNEGEGEWTASLICPSPRLAT